jgi:hypothetical protein
LVDVLEEDPAARPRSSSAGPFSQGRRLALQHDWKKLDSLRMPALAGRLALSRNEAGDDDGGGSRWR